MVDSVSFDRTCWKPCHIARQLLPRYIYIPLGGGDKQSLGLVPKLVVFTFVSLWHDLSLRLLAWGWLVVLFILPEVGATKMFPESKVGYMFGSGLFRAHLQSIV